MHRTEIFPELERGISCKGGREEGLFLTTNSNIHIFSQTLVALLVCRRLRSPESKNGTSLQLNEPSDCTIQPWRRGMRNTPTCNRGESVKNYSKRSHKVRDYPINMHTIVDILRPDCINVTRRIHNQGDVIAK